MVPWAIHNTIQTLRTGHSLEVLVGITPEYLSFQESQIRQEDQQSVGRIIAVTGILTCWVPLIGLIFSGWAWLLNRRESDWRRVASGISLIVAVLVHMLIAGVLLVNAITKM